jgi:hypothetical protein
LRVELLSRAFSAKIMIRNGYWDKVIKYGDVADEKVDLRLRLHRKRGKLERFSLIFKYDIDGKRHTIKRCDNSLVHDGWPHCHIYKAKGPPTLVLVGDRTDNMGKVSDRLVREIKKNYEKIVENYKHSR